MSAEPKQIISIREALQKPLTETEQQEMLVAQKMMPISATYKTILQMEDVLKRYRTNPKAAADTLQFYENVLKLLVLGAEVDGLARYYRKEYLEVRELLRFFMDRCKDLEEQLLDLKALELAESRISVGILDTVMRERISKIREQFKITA
ncbi:MAG: hypothetical protein ACEQSL_09425 [Sediminibacterium sp.]